MAHRVCPWWLGYLLASPLRRLMHRPETILDSYIREGMTVLEPGPGMGFFTLELARRVGPSGRVVAVDVQPKMIAGLERRIAKAGLADRVDARLVPENSMHLEDLKGVVDFTLAFAVVHEFPASAMFFGEIADASRQGAVLLVAEPAGHVPESRFAQEMKDAEQAGFTITGRPSIRHSQAALLRKT